VIVSDENKPEFDDPATSGYISQSSFDNYMLSEVTTDEKGEFPLKLTVSDQDDPEVIFSGNQAMITDTNR